MPNRRIWLYQPRETVRCPHGHTMREDVIVLEQAGIWCKARIQQHPHTRGIECGALLWVLYLPGGYQLVAEVTLPELRRMQADAMSVDEAIRYLGIPHALHTLTARPA